MDKPDRFIDSCLILNLQGCKGYLSRTMEVWTIHNGSL